MKPETTFRKKVIEDLKKLDHTEFFPIQQKAICGDPDFMLCVRGRFVGLELKSEDGRPSEIQVYKLEKIREAGGMAFCVYPSNWPEVYSILKKRSKLK